MSRVYGYARVSSKDQNLERQLIRLKEFGIEEKYIYTDKQTGKNLDRPNYLKLKNEILRSGDVLIITELDRLVRNKDMLKKEITELNNLGVRIKFLNIPTTLVDYPENQRWILDMVNNIIIEVLGAIAEEERLTIRRRQREGIDAMPIGDEGKKISIQTGRPIGRPSAEFPLLWSEIYNRYKKGEFKSSEAMQFLNLKKTTFFKLKKVWEELSDEEKRAIEIGSVEKNRKSNKKIDLEYPLLWEEMYDRYMDGEFSLNQICKILNINRYKFSQLKVNWEEGKK